MLYGHGGLASLVSPSGVTTNTLRGRFFWRFIHGLDDMALSSTAFSASFDFDHIHDNHGTTVHTSESSHNRNAASSVDAAVNPFSLVGLSIPHDLYSRWLRGHVAFPPFLYSSLQSFLVIMRLAFVAV